MYGPTSKAGRFHTASSVSGRPPPAGLRTLTATQPSFDASKRDRSRAPARELIPATHQRHPLY